jgi:hypothetical protein
MTEAATAPTVHTDTAGQVAALIRDTLTGIFSEETRDRQAGRDATRLTMSGLGGCTRACAYSIAGTEASDVPPEEEGRQAMLGNVLHEWLLPRMAAMFGPDAEVEKPVQLSAAGLTISGTLDLVWNGIVVDLKTVREYRLHGVRRHGTYTEHEAQVYGYALAEHQSGNPIRWVAWLYFDRATGDVEIRVEPFTNARAFAVIDRVENLKTFAADPDRAPREARGPGLSYACNRCPWLRRCWGDDAVPGEIGAQASIALTDPGVEFALALYKQASDAGGQAKLDQMFAKAILAQVKPGRYGPWNYRRGKDGTVLDQEQVREDYAAAGKEPPKKPTTGRILISPA